MAWALPISVLSSEFTTPAWLIFGTRLESLLRCAHRDRLSLKHEMAIRRRCATLWSHMKQRATWTRRMICLARVGQWLALVRRNCQPLGAGHARKAQITEDGSCATKTRLGVTSCGVSLHQGDERKSGHYTCSGRNGPSWHYFDDSSMREVSSRTVLASQAYMLMHERV